MDGKDSTFQKLYPVKMLLEANGGPLPMSVAGLYSAIRRGEIQCVTIGRRKFVPANELERIFTITK